MGRQGEGWQPGLKDQGKIPQGLGKSRLAQHLMVYGGRGMGVEEVTRGVRRLRH